jgi:uncharacterized integral membrane protein (TIGR00697 family)
MKKNLTKTNLYQIITGIFVACLLVSNILASKTFTLGSIVLPTAVIIFPLVYIVNDVLAEVFGFKKASNVIVLGFVTNLFAVIAYTIAIALPAPTFATETADAFALVLGSTWRMLIASFAAYLVGSFVNAYVMVRLKAKAENHLMLRCMLSTLIGEGLDAIIFITIAFVGTMPMTDLLTMIVAQALFKTVFEVIVYPLTRIVIRKVKSLEE